MVKEEFDKLLETMFIRPVEMIEWVSPMVLVLKEKWQVKAMCQLESFKQNN